MKKAGWVLFIVLAVGALLLAACGGGGDEAASTSTAAGPGRPTPPAEFAGKTNPHTDEAAVAAGEQIYQTNCASCHGESGMGDGPAAASLNPKPEPLATNEEALGDDYMYWRIAKGGNFDPFKSVMPAQQGLNITSLSQQVDLL